MLSDLIKGVTTVKLLDFIMDEWKADVSISDIAKETKTSYITIAKEVPRLVKYGLLKPSRKVGKSQLYIVDSDSAVFKTIMKADTEISHITNKEIVEKELAVMPQDETKTI